MRPSLLIKRGGKMTEGCLTKNDFIIMAISRFGMQHGMNFKEAWQYLKSHGVYTYLDREFDEINNYRLDVLLREMDRIAAGNGGDVY